MDAREQAMIDLLMKQIDGTENKGNLGANAILGVSLAVARAASEASGLPLFQYLGGAGRAHAAGADDERHQRRRARRQQPRRAGVHDHPRRLRDVQRCAARRRGDVSSSQEHPARPQADDGGRRRRRIRARSEIECRGARSDLDGDRKGGLSRRRADLPRPRRRGIRVFRERKRTNSKGRNAAARRWSTYYQELRAKYPIISIEDGMSEGDWDGWTALTKAMGASTQLVGDDRLRDQSRDPVQRNRQGIGNAILIKVNQIGTLTETLDAIEMAQARRIPLGRSRTAPARPRIRRSPIWRWRRTRDRSRPDRCRAANASRSTTSCCGSKRSWGTRRCSRGTCDFPVDLNHRDTEITEKHTVYPRLHTVYPSVLHCVPLGPAPCTPRPALCTPRPRTVYPSAPHRVPLGLRNRVPLGPHPVYPSARTVYPSARTVYPEVTHRVPLGPTPCNPRSHTGECCVRQTDSC